MENSFLLGIASIYFQKYMDLDRWPFTYLFYEPTIPDEMLVTARKIYANYDIDKEVPILLEADTLNENKQSDATKGLLITNKNIYYHLYSLNKGKKTINFIQLKEIKNFLLKPSFLCSTMIVNGESMAAVNGLNSKFKEGRKIVEELVNLFIVELNKASTDSGKNKQSYYDYVNIEPFSEIKRLKDLLDAHMIEEDEFNSRKRELLAMI